MHAYMLCWIHLQAYAKSRFKEELEQDPSLQLVERIPDRELYLWKLIKFLEVSSPSTPVPA